MDTRLKERLERWQRQIDIVGESESTFFQLEAQEKSFFGELYLKQTSGSVAEKESRVHADSEWRKFQDGLAAARAKYNRDRRMLDLIQKAFDAEYITFKIEADVIKRGNVA